MARNRLSKMRITRVSLVDRPAGIGAEVVLAKRDDEDESTMQNTSEFTGRGNMSQATVGDTEGANMGSTDGVKKSATDTVRTKRKKIVAKADEGTTTETTSLEDILKSLPPEAVDYIERLEDIIIDMKDSAGEPVLKDDEADEEADEDTEADETEGEDADDDADEDDEDDEDGEDGEDEAGEDEADDADAVAEDTADADDAAEPALAKALDSVLKGADKRTAAIVKRYVQKAEAKADRAEKLAKRERDLRLHREYVAKAADLSALPAKQEDIVKVLKVVADKAPEVEEVLNSILKAAHGALKESDIFKSEGSDAAADNTTAIAKFDAAVKDIRAADPALTAEQAFAKALDQHPELYDDYLSNTNTNKGR